MKTKSVSIIVVTSALMALVNISAEVTTMIETDFVFMVYPQGSEHPEGHPGGGHQFASRPSFARMDRPGGLSYSEGTIAQGWMRSTRVAGCAAAATAAPSASKAAASAFRSASRRAAW